MSHEIIKRSVFHPTGCLHRQRVSGCCLFTLLLLASARPRAVAALAMTGMKEIAAGSVTALLNPDGTLNPNTGFSDSLQLEGWTMIADASGRLRPVRTIRNAAAAASEVRALSKDSIEHGAWDNRFSFPGVDGEVRAIAVNGNEVYLGGAFRSAGGVIALNIAKWDGKNWFPVGPGVDGPVFGVAIKDGQIWIGGKFAKAGIQSVNNLATWNPNIRTWSDLPLPTSDTVNTITVHGNDIYVGGAFNAGILKYDGTNWQPLANGVNGAVNAIAVDETNIYVGGAFTQGGGKTLNHIARSDGTSWFALGNGVNDTVNALSLADGGALYAGGDFTIAGADAANGLAFWDGTLWSRVEGASGIIEFKSVNTLATLGGELVIGGAFAGPSDGNGVNLVRWNGDDWVGLGTGINGLVFALASDGNDLFVGGKFDLAGGIVSQNFAKWTEPGDFQSWDAGVDGYVSALAVSGSGDVYVGGDFTMTGRVAAERIARWDGANWHALGAGVSGPVRALAVSGKDVYVGGAFANAGGVNTANIARWDGVGWSALGTGVDGAVNAIAIRGNVVYVGGEFTGAGGAAASHLAGWDDAHWFTVGNGVNGTVNALAVQNARLFVGGDFSVAGATNVSRVAWWDGTFWHSLGDGVDGPVTAIAAKEDGGLYVGGQFTHAGNIEGANYVAKWDGGAWSALGNGVDGIVSAIAIAPGEIYVGGGFGVAGGASVKSAAKWNERSQSWAPLLDRDGSGVDGNVFAIALTRSEVYLGGFFAVGAAHGIASTRRTGWTVLGQGVSGTVYAATVDDNSVYAGGEFTFAGGALAANIARWDGEGWSPLGAGVNGPVRAIVVGPDKKVYAGGSFTQVDGLSALNTAVWDGSRWATLGIGLNGVVNALAVGNGKVYAGGDFVLAGGLNANRVASWDGVGWAALGDGVNGTVRALKVVGTDIFAGGDFLGASGGDASHLARWDGERWLPAAAALNGSVDAVAVSAGNIFAGGQFSSASGDAGIFSIAKWDGSDWSALGAGLNGDPSDVYALSTVPSGALYVGGAFAYAGGLTVNGVAVWDGLRWAALDNGLNGPAFAITVRGREVFVGGPFTVAGRRISYGFGRWSFDNVSPTVGFLAPSPGQTFVAPAALPIVVDALDVDGSVMRVDFYANNGLLGTATNSPYGIVWNGVAPGVYTLTARATDNDGAATMSSTVISIVSSNTPPVVQLMSPSDGESFSAPAKIILSAFAADATDQIRQVDFLADGVVLGSVRSSPFTLIWSNVVAGAYTLSARATDNFGGSATSAPVAITVTVAGLASFTRPSPLPGGQFAFQIIVPASQTLVIQASTNLTEWKSVATNSAASGVIDYVDTNAVAFKYRFYRAAISP